MQFMKVKFIQNTHSLANVFVELLSRCALSHSSAALCELVASLGTACRSLIVAVRIVAL